MLFSENLTMHLKEKCYLRFTLVKNTKRLPYSEHFVFQYLVLLLTSALLNT